MGKVISGTVNGTGSDLYVGVGFVPDWVNVFNLENASENSVKWSLNMRSAEQLAGLKLSGSTTSPLTVGTGIAIYRGGDVFSSAQTAYVAQDRDADKRDSGTGNVVTAWTLGNATNKTGNFDAAVSSTYVGEGSRICIQEDASQLIKWATITAMSNNGDGANEVTLSEVVQSGEILSITGMYDYVGVSANQIVPAGFVIQDTDVNGSGEMMFFEAGTYDG